MISISPKVYQTFDLMGPIIEPECSKFSQVKSSDLLWLQKQLKQLHKLDKDGITKIFRASRSWGCGATHILGKVIGTSANHKSRSTDGAHLDHSFYGPSVSRNDHKDPITIIISQSTKCYLPKRHQSSHIAMDIPG